MEVIVNIYVFVIGLFMGSFLNVLADRLPRAESIFGRSHCDNCKHKLAWFDLIPIFSFLSIKARCRYCKTKLSWQYPLVELITAVLFLLTWIYAPALTIVEKLLYLGLVSTFIVIFFADIRYQIIPDSMQVIFLLIAVAIKYYQGTLGITLISSLQGAAVVMAPMLLIFLATKGKGMGFADVKLAFTIGFFLGLKLGLVALYAAFIFGSIIGVASLALKKKKLKSKIAFGPFMILGIVFVMIWGNAISDWIYRVYGL